MELDVFGFELQVGDGVLGDAVGIPTADVTRGDLEDAGRVRLVCASRLSNVVLWSCIMDNISI